MTTDVRSVALKGFGNAAKAYVSGRPDYPSELLRWLRQSLGLGPGKTAIDLGAGTGKFTKLLIQTGANVIAVEPVDAMRAELAVALPLTKSIAGTAQSMDLQDSASDAVLCAQAFHWFATEAALVEIHRVMKPDGKLGLIWNVRDESVDWVADITEIIAPYEGDAPRFYKGEWRLPFSGQLFSQLRETCFTYQHVGSPQQVILDRVLSVSFIAALPKHERSTIAQTLLDLVSSHAEIKGRERIAFPYKTVAYHCTKK